MPASTPSVKAVALTPARYIPPPTASPIAATAPVP